MNGGGAVSKTPFMPLWVPDFVAKTMGLDARETGAYILLIMALWSHGGKLPNDAKKLQRIARCGREWPRVWGAISHFFTLENGTVTQSRVTEELQKVNAKREVNAHNGARGGRAKALKEKERRLADATNSPQQPEPEPEFKEDTPNGVSKKKRGTRLPDDWFLPREWGEWAVSQGHDPEAVRAEAEKFKDYWISVSGQRGTKRDWLATWRNWMRNANGKRNHTAQRPTPHGALFAGFGAAACCNDGGSAGDHGAMRDITPPGGSPLADGPDRNASEPFLRVAHVRD